MQRGEAALGKVAVRRLERGFGALLGAAAAPASTFERAFTSAPARTSAAAIWAWLSDAAHINAVCWCQDSAAFGLAPSASSVCTAGRLPDRVTVMSAVSPSREAALGSAPALTSASISFALPLRAASASGVTP